MKNRNLFAVFALPLITFGIYGLVWLVKTKEEMNSLGAKIPTAWLLIVPIANIYWLWKYSEGVDQVSGGKMSTPLAFILELFLGIIGNVILQSEFNKLASAPVMATGVEAGVTSQSSAVPGADNSMPATDFNANQSINTPSDVAAESQPINNSGYTDIASTEPVATTFQPTTPPSDVIADVVPPSVVSPENNSPSQPTPPEQL